MEKNVGCVDKVVRVIIALGLVYLGITISPWFYLLAAIVLFTVMSSWCGAYSLLGINTTPKDNKIKESAKRKKRR